MNWLCVKNWSQFQHYKDRDPAWIKLHRSLLDNYDFARLPDLAKSQLLLIWLFASQHDGKVPNDPDFLQQKLGLRKAPDLTALIRGGWLMESEQVASNVLAEPEQRASKSLALARSREKRREEKRREEQEAEEKPAADPVPGDLRDWVPAGYLPDLEAAIRAAHQPRAVIANLRLVRDGPEALGIPGPVTGEELGMALRSGAQLGYHPTARSLKTGIEKARALTTQPESSAPKRRGRGLYDDDEQGAA